MLSKNVQEIIPKIQQYLASQPIEKAWLFGSHALVVKKLPRAMLTCW